MGTVVQCCSRQSHRQVLQGGQDGQVLFLFLFSLLSGDCVDSYTDSVLDNSCYLSCYNCYSPSPCHTSSYITNRALKHQAFHYNPGRVLPGHPLQHHLLHWDQNWYTLPSYTLGGHQYHPHPWLVHPRYLLPHLVYHGEEEERQCEGCHISCSNHHQYLHVHHHNLCYQIVYQDEAKAAPGKSCFLLPRVQGITELQNQGDS